ncbi:hypothetical protein FB451DRAFT_1370808 [Mycena latifolia]|nr:hypothetical protein FB451DRAFT_1370808 [Mycena latifolia]
MPQAARHVIASTGDVVVLKLRHGASCPQDGLVRVKYSAASPAPHLHPMFPTSTATLVSPSLAWKDPIKRQAHLTTLDAATLALVPLFSALIHPHFSPDRSCAAAIKFFAANPDSVSRIPSSLRLVKLLIIVKPFRVLRGTTGLRTLDLRAPSPSMSTKEDKKRVEADWIASSAEGFNWSTNSKARSGAMHTGLLGAARPICGLMSVDRPEWAEQGIESREGTLVMREEACNFPGHDNGRAPCENCGGVRHGDSGAEARAMNCVQCGSSEFKKRKSVHGEDCTYERRVDPLVRRLEERARGAVAAAGSSANIDS